MMVIQLEAQVPLIVVACAGEGSQSYFHLSHARSETQPVMRFWNLSEALATCSDRDICFNVVSPYVMTYNNTIGNLR